MSEQAKAASAVVEPGIPEQGITVELAHATVAAFEQAVKAAAWDLHHKRAWLHGAEIAWHQMAQLTHCFRELLRRPRREHCFFDGNFWSGFGCRYAIANLSDRINNEWLTFGRLEAGGVWVFDKARIAEHVRQHLYSGFQHCPAFDEEYFELFLELFP